MKSFAILFILVSLFSSIIEAKSNKAIPSVAGHRVFKRRNTHPLLRYLKCTQPAREIYSTRNIVGAAATARRIMNEENRTTQPRPPQTLRERLSIRTQYPFLYDGTITGFAEPYMMFPIEQNLGHSRFPKDFVIMDKDFRVADIRDANGHSKCHDEHEVEPTNVAHRFQRHERRLSTYQSDYDDSSDSVDSSDMSDWFDSSDSSDSEHIRRSL